MANNIRQRSRSAWPLLGVLAAACGTTQPTEQTLPSLAVRIEAPTAYQEWFARTEACSGLAGNFQAIEWYVVPGVNSFMMDGAERAGMWQRRDGRSQIVIAGNYADHEMVVSHEILHDLLGRQGHPEEFFESRCPLTWSAWYRQTSAVHAHH